MLGRRGKNISTIVRLSPAFSPASKQFILGGVDGICRKCICLPYASSHVLGCSLYFVLSAAALRARIKNSLWEMCKSAKAWFPWSVPVMSSASAPLLAIAAYHGGKSHTSRLLSVSLCLCHTVPRKLSSGPVILGNPDNFLCLQG